MPLLWPLVGSGLAGIGIGAGGAVALSDSARKTLIVVGLVLVAYKVAK